MKIIINSFWWAIENAKKKKKKKEKQFFKTLADISVHYNRSFISPLCLFQNLLTALYNTARQQITCF